MGSHVKEWAGLFEVVHKSDQVKASIKCGSSQAFQGTDINGLGTWHALLHPDEPALAAGRLMGVFPNDKEVAASIARREEWQGGSYSEF